METLVNSRRRSIDEYRAWLRPYIAKYKSMREGTEGKGGWGYVNNAFSTPGFGTMDAWSFVRIWAWRPFQPVEGGKPEAIVQGGLSKRKGFMIDPYDDFVKYWQGKIEKNYGIRFKDGEVENILENALKRNESAHCASMESQALYYLLFDFKILLNTLRSPPPEGVEMDNIMFIPIKIWVMSQNSMLIHILEIEAREKYMEKYMNEIIGTREVEEDIFNKVEAEFSGKKEGSKEEKKESIWNRIKPKYYTKVNERGFPENWEPNRSMKFVRFFVRPGPYEAVFFERASKMYFRASGFYYKQMLDLIKGAMKIE
jgi:hypothetical protein